MTPTGPTARPCSSPGVALKLVALASGYLGSQSRLFKFVAAMRKTRGC